MSVYFVKCEYGDYDSSEIYKVDDHDDNLETFKTAMTDYYANSHVTEFEDCYKLRQYDEIISALQDAAGRLQLIKHQAFDVTMNLEGILANIESDLELVLSDRSDLWDEYIRWYKIHLEEFTHLVCFNEIEFRDFAINKLNIIEQGDTVIQKINFFDHGFESSACIYKLNN